MGSNVRFVPNFEKKGPRRIGGQRFSSQPNYCSRDTDYPQWAHILHYFSHGSCVMLAQECGQCVSSQPRVSNPFPALGLFHPNRLTTCSCCTTS
ncbi:hypothetical protein Mp_4g21370 [Marchantia polymorpha subsp. ruderalis]|uniref:Uncharacterized protein n=2 Tax=Marchantia polymorpha TaxID=3197 RepID=A0AAF6BCA1_MARPO|nr:hypothetical protein MARPO_0090s0084 [Marchantia polymorpha]BBN09635.1 hypothetical protein Mp_4g21370 [Marchantia polymorpha subsp. ruderalis]|eukprot:PTQ33351.1 hypothetical protein MARPO_0090s0084 [Marchantia polymorpha]